METKRGDDKVMIIRMPHGGFMVHESPSGTEGYYRTYLFASSTLEESFKFVKKYLLPANG